MPWRCCSTAAPMPSRFLQAAAPGGQGCPPPLPYILHLLLPPHVFDLAVLLLGTQQGISHGASSLLQPSLLLSDLGYGRDGRHQATAAGQGPSSATPTTHERRICSCLLLQDAMEVMVVVAQVKPKIVETRTILLVVVSQVKPWSGFYTSGSLAQSLEANK